MPNSDDKQSQKAIQSDEEEFSTVPSRASRRHRALKHLALGILFLVAALSGFLWQNRIVAFASTLFPSPSRGRQVLYWTSPMNSTYRSDKPGKDAMGMDLVPVYEDASAPQGPIVIDPVLTEQDYATVTAEKGPLVRTIHTVGTIEYAEPLVGDVSLKIDGWLEKLYVDYEGQPVRRGEPLFDLYSPKLVSTQEDFLISVRALQQAKETGDPTVVKGAQQIVDTARQRLQFWDVTNQQIDELAKTGKVRKALTFYSPFDGIVVQKDAVEGKFVSAGQLLYRIADLSRIWVNVFVYQNQIHCVVEGQEATLHLANLPDCAFHGKVVYIYPYLDPTNRAVKVRLEFENPDLLLKPGMFADVRLASHEMGTGVKVPEKAILQTGERSLVFLSEPDNKFSVQEVTTGMELDGGMIEVVAGLQAGQQIVAAPSFLMDSESRLRAAIRRFGPAPDWTERMPSMDMQGMKMPATNGNQP